MAIGIVLGVLIGSFRSVEAFLEPQIGFLRYIPASALTPLFLLWLGIDEAPEDRPDHRRHGLLQHPDGRRRRPRPCPRSWSTPPTRWAPAGSRVLRRVILPHRYPGIIDVARINLAAAWLMLVVAELLAAEEGLAFRVVRAQRFRKVDTHVRRAHRVRR